MSKATKQRGRGMSRLAMSAASAMVLAIMPARAANAVWVTDPADMADASGDIRGIQAEVMGDNLHLSMWVEHVAAPSTGQTPDGMNNRYYYHWLLDTDNDPATGRSNAEYEETPTGVVQPIGAELVVQVGWRDGKPNGIEVYNAETEATLFEGFFYQARGSRLHAVLPLADLGLLPGQTIAVSAFEEGSSDDWATDWMESGVLTLEGLTGPSVWVTDADDIADDSGDLRGVQAYVLGENLYLGMTVQHVAGPAMEQTPDGMNNRYYYHWLLDTDNDPATGRSNAEYEENPTGVTTPIGAELVVQVGWRDGKPNGIEVYNAETEATLFEGFPYQLGGSGILAVLPLADLGLLPGQTIAVSAFEEGSSNDWETDWMEPGVLTLEGPVGPAVWVTDADDIADDSGDLRGIRAHVEGENLVLGMAVQHVAGPALEQTPDGMNNRYYYHWLLDTDNDPATGRSNAEYEETPTGVTTPIGAELVVQVGWRDGKPNGIEVYNAETEATLFEGFPYQLGGSDIVAVLPLAALGLLPGQTIAISAFEEGSSNDWETDWMEPGVLTLDALSSGRMKIDGDFADWTEAASEGLVVGVDDPADMADSSGDLKRIEATVENGYVYLRMAVHGIALPSVEQTPPGMNNRYYYHWLLDTDNNPATGRSNSEYEETPTGVVNPIGAERVVQVGWRDGAPNGIEVYDAVTEETLLVDFEYAASGDSVEAKIPFAPLGVVSGQTVAISAFEEGSSDDWATDWMESTVLALVEPGAGGLSLETEFAGNPYGFSITVYDGDGGESVDAGSVSVAVDGAAALGVRVDYVADPGYTRITGRNPALLPAGELHKVTLTCDIDGMTEAATFSFKVPAYEVLPLAGRFTSLDTANKGFVASVTQISSVQTSAADVHHNVADTAEEQLAGELENFGVPYFNEADLGCGVWCVEPVVVSGVVNWYELAPAESYPTGFPNDEVFPKLGELPGQGIELQGDVIELLTYLELEQGYNQLGLFTEGGHKISNGFSPDGLVLSQFDNSGDPDPLLVPSYYPRSQVFGVVAPEAGFYPFRFLWFQSDNREAPGMLLELFSVKDKKSHLLNDESDPLAMMAYRAGVLIDPDFVAPTLSASSNGTTLHVSWTGILQTAGTVDGPWSDFGNDSQSPADFSLTENPSLYFRARSN